MQIRMARIAIPDERFVMAAPGAQRARPAGLAVVFRVDVPPIEEVSLLLSVEAGSNVAHCMLIRIDEAVAGSNVSGRPHTQQAEAGAARMRFVHALAEFRKRVADIRKSMKLSAQSEFQVLLRKKAKLTKNGVHAGLADCVQPVRRGGDGCESDLVEAEIFLEVPVDTAYVRHSSR